MDEGAGNVVHDLSGYGHNGTIVSATWEPESLHFDGSNDYVDLGTAVGNFGTGEFTISAWVYSTADASNYAVTGNGQTAANDWLLYNNAGDLRFYADAGVGDIRITDWFTDRLNQWVHIVVRGFIGAGIDLDLWGNGILLGSDTTFSQAIGLDHNTIIGACEDGTARFWAGNIRNVLFWNRALSPSEIQQLYADPEAWRPSVEPLLTLAYTSGGAPATNPRTHVIWVGCLPPLFILGLSLAFVLANKQKMSGEHKCHQRKL